MNTDTAQAATELQALLGTLPSGSLRFWGVWFGRPFDNCHMITSIEAKEEEILHLTFDEGEMLSVWKPAHWSFSKSEFIIGSATRVFWQWHLYGKPMTTDHLMSYDFVKTERSINLKSTFPRREATLLDVVEPAVKMYLPAG